MRERDIMGENGGSEAGEKDREGQRRTEKDREEGEKGKHTCVCQSQVGGHVNKCSRLIKPRTHHMI